MTPVQIEKIKLAAMSVIGAYITCIFVLGYIRGKLPTPFFLLSLAVIIPAWLVVLLVWRRLLARDKNDQKPK